MKINASIQALSLALLSAAALTVTGCEKLRTLRGGATRGSNATVARGPGAFVLENPGATEDRTDALPALQQRLVLTTRSTAGQSARSVHARLRVARDRYRSEVETVDQDGQPVRVLTVREGRAVYVRAGTGRCSGELREDSPAESLVNPARLLPSIRGATPAGEEILGGEPTRKYTFDQSALSTNPSLRAQGTVWIAAQGGWVARYALRATDATGERTWEYTASRVSEQTPVRPAECGAVLEEVATPPGAQREERASGSLRYQSAQPVAALRAFNAQALGALGYRLRAALREDASEQLVLFDHPQSRRLALLALHAEGGVTHAQVQVADPPSDAAIASAQRAAPQAQRTAPTLAPAVAALARYLPDTLSTATASDAPNGAATTMFGMRTTMAMRNYQAGPHTLRVMISQGDVARMARSVIASGPSDREVAAGARRTTLAGLPATITVEGAQVKLQCVLEGGLLLDLQLAGPGAAGADALVGYANALDLAALRRVR
jgi:hypothetical protein